MLYRFIAWSTNYLVPIILFNLIVLRDNLSDWLIASFLVWMNFYNFLFRIQYT